MLSSSGIGEAEKAEFLGNAEALLFQIAWPEPFGMVMIEAASCGAPVIAFGSGSVPEVIEYGMSGFIVSNWQVADFVAGYRESGFRAPLHKRPNGGALCPVIRHAGGRRA